MSHDDEDRWEEKCEHCPHYLAEHHDEGCGGFDPDRYDTVCPCFTPG